MSKQYYQFGIGSNNNDQIDVCTELKAFNPDEKLGEVENAILNMLKHGMPPEQILENILEHYENPNISYEESRLQKANEALRIFMEKYQNSQRAVSKLGDPAFSCDSLKIVISPNSGKSSRPQSRGFRDHLEKGYYGDENCSQQPTPFIFNSHVESVSRPQSRSALEKQHNVENSVSSLQQSRAEEQPFFLVRSVSRDELRAVIMQPPPQESSAAYFPQQFDEQMIPQIDLEPSKETPPKKEPLIENTPVLSELENQENKLVPQHFPPIPQILVVDDATTNEQSPREFVAEKLIEKEAPVKKLDVHSKPINTSEITKKSRAEQKSKNALPTPQKKPPTESSLAGGEGSFVITQPQTSSDIRDVPHITQSAVPRSSHRTNQSATRSGVSRKKSSISKKKENNIAKFLIVTASFLGFIAVGGYVIYKNRYGAMYY